MPERDHVFVKNIFNNKSPHGVALFFNDMRLACLEHTAALVYNRTRTMVMCACEKYKQIYEYVNKYTHGIHTRAHRHITHLDIRGPDQKPANLSVKTKWEGP